MQKELQVLSRNVEILLSKVQVTKMSQLNFRPAADEEELEKLITDIKVQNEKNEVTTC